MIASAIQLVATQQPLKMGPVQFLINPITVALIVIVPVLSLMLLSLAWTYIWRRVLLLRLRAKS